MGTAFPSHNRADNTQARHPGHITHDVVQVEMHLVERLVHGLNMLSGQRHQVAAMAEQAPELTNGLRRTKRRR